MIDANKRKVAYSLFKDGKSEREISHTLSISRTAVRKAIEMKGEYPIGRIYAINDIDEEHIRDLYAYSNGYVQRLHELLIEEGYIIAYSSLTEKVRKMGLKKEGKKSKRCERVPDVAGEEMQHDTTIYNIMIDNVKVKLIASIVYLRYSKIRYLKLYRSFDRFCMKCFLHEALSFFGYSPKYCIIDNTNLARLSGSGYDAKITPEMVAFSRQYGFKFRCHAINHPNRKAGNERAFWTTETNFLPGRTFKSLEDLNKQALVWSTEKMANRPQSGTGLIPAIAYEYEKTYLQAINNEISAPYRPHTRKIDAYGYIHFKANFYWIPEDYSGEVDVLEYSKYIDIFQHRNKIATYNLPLDGSRRMQITPEGFSKPKNKPNESVRKDSITEESKLRKTGKDVSQYIDYLKTQGGVQQNRLIRSLYRLSLKVELHLLNATLKRAKKYGVTDKATIEQIAYLLMRESNQLESWNEDFSEDISNRSAYRAGETTNTHPLEDYDKDISDKSDEEDNLNNDNTRG